ncbi:precorrin-6y C5,15-methyltransferase (decarboxylating) subunit CbiE [Orenia metallireducens]|jgi:cobalt-precorrin-7 (C5)-methyltransferase|uniref:Precorrin-6y C5,15-methyltransferase (Decarboxylating) subunit CbiE n=1 Tax=Orenia metallireducens TaxID=1413210 RepID=A0A1C0A7D8_9FIRM|nr:precorrin-6y C5,15-methyltransferase (decarboxylating) subunit CbiE [Orenia metallireducens]OCL26128.1 precorrin-6y C5,15-methyltransferase (decarboxylating) subunit CbiE [Orenia metallireducens]
MNKIHILGIGPGSRDYLLPITERIVSEADTIIGGSRALELFKDYTQEKILITADLAKIKDYVKENYLTKKIAVLVSGDPGLYSMLNYLKRFFSKDELEVIPGISAIQLAFAKAKLIWQDAYITSFHGKKDKKALLEMVSTKDKVAFFTDSKFPPNEIAKFLVENGITNKIGVVAENLSYDSERIVEASLEDLSKQKFAKLTVMVICNE